MKGKFIQKNLEYNLEIRGESWTQGNLIIGSLKIKSDSAQDLSSTGVFLAYVNSKKFKAKDDKAFVLLQEDMSNAGSFKFQLEKDCPITESAGSLYILCGQKDNFYEGGHLELNITPHKTISDFMQLLEFQYRFKFKALKNKKDFIEAVVSVPEAKKYTSIQQLKIYMKMQEETLCLKFLFKLKKVDFASATLSTKDEKLELTLDLTAKDYQIYGDAFNQEGVSKHIDELLSKVKVNSFL